MKNRKYQNSSNNNKYKNKKLIFWFSKFSKSKQFNIERMIYEEVISFNTFFFPCSLILIIRLYFYLQTISRQQRTQNIDQNIIKHDILIRH